MAIDIKKGDRVRIIKIMADMKDRPQIVVGNEYDVFDVASSFKSGPVLIKYQPSSGWSHTWWIPFGSYELVEASIRDRIVRKINDIKERRVRLGYQY